MQRYGERGDSSRPVLRTRNQVHDLFAVVGEELNRLKELEALLD